MQLRSLPRGIRRGSQVAAVSLSPPARRRLEALTLWQRTGQWRLAAEIFGMSRATLYRWRQRYDSSHLGSLEARSRRPRRVRASPLPAAVVRRIQALREQYPRWGREKLRVLLAREGMHVSAKTIDRVLARLRPGASCASRPGDRSRPGRGPGRGPLRSASPRGMWGGRPATSSSSTPWTCGRCPGWCASI